MSDSFVRACLITNPKSGRGGVDLSEVLTVLQANGWDVTVCQKLKGGMAEELARDAVVTRQRVIEASDSIQTGKRLRKRATWFTQRYQVITVGGDTFTAAREKDGRVVKVQVTPDTSLKEFEGGAKRPLWGGLTALNAEDIVRIKGVKGSIKGSIIAYRVKRETPAAARALQAG